MSDEKRFPVATDDEIDAVLPLLVCDEAEAKRYDWQEITGSLIARICADRVTIEALRTPEGHAQEAMGFVLGVIDCARTIRPPVGTTSGDALDHFADRVEQMAAHMYGEKWGAFVTHVRACSGHGHDSERLVH